MQVARGGGEALALHHMHEHRKVIEVAQGHLGRFVESVCLLWSFKGYTESARLTLFVPHAAVSMLPLEVRPAEQPDRSFK